MVFVTCGIYNNVKSLHLNLPGSVEAKKLMYYEEVLSQSETEYPDFLGHKCSYETSAHV